MSPVRRRRKVDYDTLGLDQARELVPARLDPARVPAAVAIYVELLPVLARSTTKGVPLYLVRWPDLSGAFVNARNEDDLLDILDEISNPEAARGGSTAGHYTWSSD